jgi:hypothetical protein
MIDVKNIKPILQPKKRLAKDPIRFPKVIGEFEIKSKRDFTTNLQMELKMLINEMYK